MNHPPRSTRLGRIADYLFALFPPWSHVPIGVGLFAWVHFALQATTGQPTLQVSWRFAAGAITVVLLTLLLRVYDELKDAEHDQRLAAAGDPRYADRPIVTGHVTVDDLALLRWSITAALVAINAAMGALVFAAFAVVFAWTWLSFRWFFWPAMKRDLLAAFVTHNPMVIATTAYTCAVFASELGTLPSWPVLGCLALGSWMPFGGWELARKIRLPDDETDYQTYSKIFGVSGAAMLPVLCAVVATIAVVAVALASGLSPLYLAAVPAATAVVTAASLRLVVRPSRAATRLQPFAELYLAIVVIGFPAAAIAGRGLVWS